MTQQGQALRSRLSAAAPPGRGYPAAALALALAGACFALYPAIRPFSDETTLRGAQAFASASWQVAHTLAMVAFILLTLGLWGLYARLRGSGTRPAMREIAEILARRLPTARAAQSTEPDASLTSPAPVSSPIDRRLLGDLGRRRGPASRSLTSRPGSGRTRGRRRPAGCQDRAPSPPSVRHDRNSSHRLPRWPPPWGGGGERHPPHPASFMA